MNANIAVRLILPKRCSDFRKTLFHEAIILFSTNNFSLFINLHSADCVFNLYCLPRSVYLSADCYCFPRSGFLLIKLPLKSDCVSGWGVPAALPGCISAPHDDHRSRSHLQPAPAAHFSHAAAQQSR